MELEVGNPSKKLFGVGTESLWQVINTLKASNRCLC
jgi:hypothetical protein